MDAITPVQESAEPRKCLRFSEKTQTGTADSYEISSPPSRYVEPSTWTQLSESSGTTLVDFCNNETPPAKKSRLPTSTGFLDQQWLLNGSTETVTIRSVFRKWRQKLPKLNGNTKSSSTAVQNPESIAADIIAHLSTNFSVLIERAILNHPSQTRSIYGICKDIMRIDDWYRTHKKSGWQQIVAQELAQNPKFQLDIHCRKGKIKKWQIIRWRLASTRVVEGRNAPWQPQVMSRVRFELPDTTARDTSEDTMPSPEVSAIKPVTQKSPSYAGAIGASAIPLCQHPQFNSVLMDSTSQLERRSTTTLIDCYLDDTGAGIDRTTSKQPVGKIGPHDCPSAWETEPSSSGIELYDEPMDMNMQHTTCNGHQSGASQGTIPSQKSDQSNDGGQNLSSSQGLGSGVDRQKGPEHPDDGNGDRKRKRFCSPEEYKNQRRFACVYHKYDPETYSAPNRRYLVCAGAGFKFISELIRHLYRVHGENICGKCLEQFDNAQQLSMHKAQCTVRLPCSQEELWAALWHARFPNVPVPDDRYLANSLRPPQPRVETQLGLSPGGSTLSSAHPSSPSLFEMASHSSNPSTLPSTPNDNIQRDRELTIRLMELRIESLERRLPVVETTLSFVLRTVPPFSDIKSKNQNPAFGNPAQTACSGNSQAQGGNDLASEDVSSYSMDPRALQAETASNYPPVGSSCASSSGLRSRSHSNQDIHALGFDQMTMLEKYDVFFPNAGDGNDGLPDLSMPDVPDLYIEGCDDPLNHAIQVLPDA